MNVNAIQILQVLCFVLEHPFALQRDDTWLFRPLFAENTPTVRAVVNGRPFSGTTGT